MNVVRTEIEGVVIIEPRIFSDGRGYFFESFSERDFERHTGVHVRFVQDNESRSSYGVVRGLHFQKGAASQAKLLRVVSGKVLDNQEWMDEVTSGDYQKYYEEMYKER